MNINHKTKIFGILGGTLSHTLSPLIHNGLFEDIGYDAVYLTFEKANPTKNFLLSDSQIKISGLSVTIPHKEWAYSIADKKDETSNYMSSSNTLLVNDNTISCFNTDGIGAVKAVEMHSKNFFSKNKGDILILGSGGSARGISYAFLKENDSRKIVISARNRDKSLELVTILNGISNSFAEYIPLDKIKSESKRFSLIINTTPIGMKDVKEKHLLPKEFINSKHLIFDIVYNPIKTPLVEMGMKSGAKIIPGYEMLIRQAMLQFELFTNITPTEKQIKVVRKRVEKALGI